MLLLPDRRHHRGPLSRVTGQERRSADRWCAPTVLGMDSSTATIAVIGTGRVGTAVGTALAAAGRRVVYGSRTPGDGRVGVAEALAESTVVLVAIPAEAVDGLAREHAAALDGKLVLDATNSFGAGPANAAATFAEHVPTARYARAFNNLGAEAFADPTFDGAPADLFYSCTAADRAAVEDLVAAVGLRPVFVGEGNHEVVDGVMRL
ncbi:NAD(P)-binding domain-containing protein [Nocardia sp. NPDC051833]|uniref:NADPH-dependent F420 reductase n=1 Tax=Nocardia sp. NPDC051833 TaxID=3155674 RepID=UPI00343A2C9B